MEKTTDLYKKYVDIGYDEQGIYNSIKINCPDDFNFGYDVIDWYAAHDPGRRALMWVDVAGRELMFTYGELGALSTRAANLFREQGVKKGDKVMLVLKRNYQFWFAVIGLTKLGAVAIPATHLLTVKDYVYRFKEAGVTGIVATGLSADIAANIDEADKELGGVLGAKLLANVSELPAGWVDFDRGLEAASPTMEREKTDCRETMLLYFTSGTTGYPKMVTHNHRYALAHMQTAIWQNVDPDGIHLTISDTGWAKAAWGKLYGQMLLGSTVFVYDFDRFVPGEMLAVMSKYKITTFCAPPTMFRFFIKEGLAGYDLSALKYCVIAGEALNPEVFDRWYEFTGIKLMEGFGQTEATLLLANFPGMTPRPGSMGKPTPLYRTALVDENNKPVPPGEIGEIVVLAEKGDDGMFDGYYRGDELTDKVWSGGVYHTGDTAWKDEDGYYWYVGRNDDVIKSSGYRIGPFEIESVLITHQAVLECAVTGAPDPTRGTVVKATIVLTKGYQGSEALQRELQQHVIKNTAPYKYPRVIEFVDELPKTISGKIKRAQIRSEDSK